MSGANQELIFAVFGRKLRIQPFVTTHFMKRTYAALGILLSATFVSSISADVFTIGTFTFNEANAVRTAEIVEGPVNLRDYRNDEFTKRSQLDIILNEKKQGSDKIYKYFDRSKCVGQLLSRGDQKGIARYITFPEKATAPPTPNVDSSTLEFTWGSSDLRDISGFDGGPDLFNKLHTQLTGSAREKLLSSPSAVPARPGEGQGSSGRSLGGPARAQYLVGWALENKDGPDFVVYESGSYEPFSVYVRRSGTDEFTQPRYQFASYFDPVHNVNAVAFDLDDFGIGKGEMIDAIRIRNVFNSYSRHGSDRVDDESGQGNVVYPGDPGYGNSHMLLNERGGREFKIEQLDADIIYIVGLHDIVPLDKSGRAGAQPASAAEGDSSN